MEKTTIRQTDLKNELTTRLNRIEGQVRGVNKMITEDKYCDNIMIQIVAIKSALDAVSKRVLEHHMRTCLPRDIAKNEDEVIDELLKTIGRMVK